VEGHEQRSRPHVFESDPRRSRGRRTVSAGRRWSRPVDDGCAAESDRGPCQDRPRRGERHACDLGRGVWRRSSGRHAPTAAGTSRDPHGHAPGRVERTRAIQQSCDRRAPWRRDRGVGDWRCSERDHCSSPCRAGYDVRGCAAPGSSVARPRSLMRPPHGVSSRSVFVASLPLARAVSGRQSLRAARFTARTGVRTVTVRTGMAMDLLPGP
jgi:hypothetical protein